MLAFSGKIVEAMHASKALPLKATSSADDEEEVDNDALELDTDFEDEDWVFRSLIEQS